MNKKYDFPEKLNITITCASGVEKVTKTELFRLLGLNAPAVNGTISFSGSISDVVKCNLHLRTADRVYIKVGEFSATTFDEIFEVVKNLSWESFIPKNARIIINGKCVKSKIFAISACQSIINKAVAVRLCEKYRINSLEESGENYEIVFSLFKDVLSVFLNTSGDGLHKRGYRDLVGIAPIKETLGSALLLLSDFYYKDPFLDPFCGSGTLPIEATKIALNIAPNISRRFAFNNWENFDSAYYNLAYEQAKDNEIRDRKLEIFGSDIDKKAVELAIHHAKNAGVDKYIRFCVSNVKNVKNALSNGTIVTNPPYGERVYDRKEAEECYKNLRTTFDKLDNWSLFLITSAKNFEKCFNKRADRIRKLYNSNKECNFYYYYKNKGERK